MAAIIEDIKVKVLVFFSRGSIMTPFEGCENGEKELLTYGVLLGKERKFRANLTSPIALR